MTTPRMAIHPKAVLILATAALGAGCATQNGPSPSPADHVADDTGGIRDIAELARIEDAEPKDVPPSAYGNPDTYQALGQEYSVMDPEAVDEGFTQRGSASWYGSQFHGDRTSSGTPYDMYAMTAAHRELPLPTWVRITNLENHRSAVVKVNDRGPFVEPEERIIDVSYAAAVKLGMADQGTAPVEIQVVTPDTRQESAGQEAPSQRSQEEKGTQPAASPAESHAMTRHNGPDVIERLVERPQTAPCPIHSADETRKDAPRPEPDLLPPAVTAAADIAEASLYLQAGAYSKRDNAVRMRARAHAIGVQAQINELTLDGETLLRVRLGPLRSLSELDKAERMLQEAGIDPFLVTPR